MVCCSVKVIRAVFSSSMRHIFEYVDALSTKVLVRGAIKRKKLVFFGHCPNERDPPAPPINLDTQNFSVKENFGLSQIPPLLYEKMSKKNQFWAKYPKKMRFFGYFAQFSAKTLLDWVRPPPPFGQKVQKNLSFFDNVKN